MAEDTHLLLFLLFLTHNFFFSSGVSLTLTYSPSSFPLLSFIHSCHPLLDLPQYWSCPIVVPLIIPSSFWQAFLEENAVLLDLKGLRDLATLLSAVSGALVPAGVFYCNLGLREQLGEGTSRRAVPRGEVPQPEIKRLSPRSNLGGVTIKMTQPITIVHKPLYTAFSMHLKVSGKVFKLAW